MVQRRRFLLASLGLLVIMNLGLMGSIFFQKQGHDRPGQGGLEHFLEQELSLSPDQVEQMHTIRKQHFDTTLPLVAALRDSSEFLVLQAFMRDLDSTRATAIAKNIGGIHTQLDLALYGHFVKLNEMCTPEQRVRLKELAYELTGGTSPPPQRGQAPPGERPGRGNRPPPGAQRPPGGGPPPRGR